MSTWFKEITWKHAEEILGERVDRRCKFFTHSEEGLKVADNPYVFANHKVFVYGTWTGVCSGCYSQGCSECGYTGKRREGMHIPYGLRK